MAGIWVLAGLIGFFLLVIKGKMGFGSVGCILWILFGWWIVPIMIAVGGGILLAIGWAVKADVRCPHCREKINRQATKCPHCHSELTPAGTTVPTSTPEA
jgi:hypothetical protein